MYKNINCLLIFVNVNSENLGVMMAVVSVNLQLSQLNKFCNFVLTMRLFLLIVVHFLNYI